MRRPFHSTALAYALGTLLVLCLCTRPVTGQDDARLDAALAEAKAQLDREKAEWKAARKAFEKSKAALGQSTDRLQEKLEKVYGRWGAPVLFFAWLPFVGDPLTVAAGVLRVNLYVFTFWVVLGKMFRYYILIAAVTGQGVP